MRKRLSSDNGGQGTRSSCSSNAQVGRARVSGRERIKVVVRDGKGARARDGRASGIADRDDGRGHPCQL